MPPGNGMAEPNREMPDMRISLGLAGDLDDMDLVRDIEQSFGIALPEAEFPDCRTVGDLFALVAARLPDGTREAGRCASAMCFHRVRRTVLMLAPHLDLRPSTPISVLRAVPVRQLYRAVRTVGGLRPPVPFASAWAVCGLALAVAAPIAPLLLGFSWWMALAWVLASAALYHFAPIRLPPEVATFGDLAERVAALNIGQLALQGARLGRTEAWTAFRTICECHACGDDGEIGLGTLILQPRGAAP